MNIIEKYRPINSKEKVDSLISTQRCLTPLCKKEFLCIIQIGKEV